MRIQTIGAIVLSAAMAIASSTALAHGPGGGYPGSAEQGYGPMMGHGQGPMMGQGYGPMMGQSQGPMMQQGCGRAMGGGYGQMMGRGHGMGHGMGWVYGPMMGQGRGQMMGPHGMMGQGGLAPLAEDLSVDGVRHIMEHRLAMRQNPNLKLGEIVEKDDDTITAEVVTQEGSLVRRFIVDRHTGMMRPEDMEQ